MEGRHELLVRRIDQAFGGRLEQQQQRVVLILFDGQMQHIHVVRNVFDEDVGSLVHQELDDLVLSLFHRQHKGRIVVLVVAVQSSTRLQQALTHIEAAVQSSSTCVKKNILTSFNKLFKDNFVLKKDRFLAFNGLYLN